MKRILVTSTEAMMLSFLTPHIRNLLQNGWTIEIACSEVKGRFHELRDVFGADVKIHKVELERNPAKRKNLQGLRQLKAIIRAGKYDLIWTNEPVMGVMTRLAAREERKRGLKLIYMAHGFHFYKGAPLINWLLFFPIERLCSHWTDILVTINHEDYYLARKWMKAGRIEYIPGIGVDLDRFRANTVDRESKRQELGVSTNDRMILSVGELTPRKNHRLVLEALEQIGDSGIRYFICGDGPLESELKEYVREKRMDDRVSFLGYRRDISALCQASDLFVFPSLQEEVSVALMEAIATRTAVVCSDIRGNTDLVEERELLFDPKDVSAAAQCIERALHADMSDSVERHYEKLQAYDLRNVVEELGKLYGAGELLTIGGGLLKLYEQQVLKNELGIPASAMLLLSVAELSNRKNQAAIIEAMHRTEDLDAVCLLVGEGDKEEEFKERIRQLGLGEKIRLLGYRRDIDRLCRCADIFVHIPVREGLGMAPLEAMASGLPLVSSYINGLKDYTLDDVTGICVMNPRDSGEVAQALRMMVGSRQLRRRSGATNPLIARKYNLQSSVSRFSAIYSSVITGD